MSSEPEGLVLDLGPGRGWVVAVLRAGDPVDFDQETWRDALVLVQSGALRITCRSGRTVQFAAGAIVYFRGLELATIGAGGGADAVLLALRREPR